MIDLDAFAIGEPGPATANGAGPRKCYRHAWSRTVLYEDEHMVEPPRVECIHCGAVRDEARARRGRQSRNYGNRAELDVARRYGGRKVGHAQGPTDVAGATRKLQVKTSRRTVPPMWAREFAKLESEADGRLPILLLRFVRAGNLGPDDYFVIQAADFLAWYGRDGETP